MTDDNIEANQLEKITLIMANYLPDTFRMSILVTDEDMSNCCVYVNDATSHRYGQTTYRGCYADCLEWIVEYARVRRHGDHYDKALDFMKRYTRR